MGGHGQNCFALILGGRGGSFFGELSVNFAHTHLCQINNDHSLTYFTEKFV